MIAGLVPLSSGDLLLNGKKQSTYKEKNWFQQLSYISQKPLFIFRNESEECRRWQSRDVTREEIEVAAEKAGITDWYVHWSAGYDHHRRRWKRPFGRRKTTSGNRKSIFEKAISDSFR